METVPPARFVAVRTDPRPVAEAELVFAVDKAKAYLAARRGFWRPERCGRKTSQACCESKTPNKEE